MNYTDKDLMKVAEMARDIRYITYSNDEIIETVIKEKEDQQDSLTEMMEISQKAGLYEDAPKTDFLGRNIEKIFTEVDIADAIYMSKVGVGSVNGSTYLTTHQIIEKLKDRKWPKNHVHET